MQELAQYIDRINAFDSSAQEMAKIRWDKIAKPLNSLGKLEKAVSQMAGIFGKDDFDIDKKALVVMCADNGVVEEGVTQTGQEVTAIVAENFLDEASCAAIMCKQTKTTIRPIDIGMAVDTLRVEKKKIAYGPKICKRACNDKAAGADALKTGINIVKEMKSRDIKFLQPVMGNRKYYYDSAVCAVMLEKDVEEVTGRGAGLSTEGLNKKISVIKNAIEKYKPDKNDIVDVISKVGGFDIAGLTGLFLGGAIYHIPIVIDGFISAVSALLAVSACPKVSDYILASHVSKEPAGHMVLGCTSKISIFNMRYVSWRRNGCCGTVSTA